MQYMERILRNSKIEDDCGVLIEYTIPNTSKRVDFIVTGRNEKQEKNYVLVELKQWEEASATDIPELVHTFVGGGFRDVLHPSYQAESYSRMMGLMNEGIYDNNIIGFPCVYLHNYERKTPEPLLDSRYRDGIKQAPIYFMDDYRKLQDYFDVMILRDLVEHWQISKPRMVRYFLKRVMTTIGSRLSVNAIYREIKASGRKVTKDDLYDWLAWAQSIYLVRKLDVYSRSVKSEVSLPGKYYVTDVGLRSAVIPLQSDDDGKRLENTVYIELIRRKSHNEELSYFNGDGECDFVVSEGEVVKRLVQVTWDMADVETRTREFSGILEAARATGCRDLSIITRDEEGEEIHGDLTVRIVPVCKFLLSKPPSRTL